MTIDYDQTKCEHGNHFSRLPFNIKSYSKCDCVKLSKSGVKGIYKQLNGKWAAKVQLTGTGKQKSIGTYDTIEEAKQAQLNYERNL